jgi:hypothetical protein
MPQDGSDNVAAAAILFGTILIVKIYFPDCACHDFYLTSD